MRQVPWTRRRILWTVGVGLGAFFFGGKGGVWGTVLSSIWGASIGYGIGSIFDLEHPTKRVVGLLGGHLGAGGPFLWPPHWCWAVAQPFRHPANYSRRRRRSGSGAPRPARWNRAVEETSPKIARFRLGCCRLNGVPQSALQSGASRREGQGDTSPLKGCCTATLVAV